MPTRSTVRAEGRHLTERTGPVRFPVGGGAMGALMRGHDWSASPLGHPGTWPPTLRSAVNLMLQSKVAMFLAWGPDLAFLYNDAYVDILGDKHPAALGSPFRSVWGEIWADISPLIDRAISGEAVHHEHLPLTMHRHGYDEETWFTFSYSPVHDESGAVRGMFCSCLETTGQVLAERSLRDSEARWRGVFQIMHEGFVVGEVVRAPGGQAVDWRYVEVNGGWERMTGIPAGEATGRLITEVVPGIERRWITTLVDVVETGEPAHVEGRAAAMGRWFSISAYRSGPDRFVMMFLNITERKAAEARRDALVELGDRLRGLRDPGEIAHAAAGVVGRALGAARAGYGTMDAAEQDFRVERDWTDGRVASCAGEWRIGDYWPGYADELRRDAMVAIDDVARDTRTAGPIAEAHAAIGVRAQVCAAVVEAGRVVAILFVHAAAPRRWSAEEVEFVRGVAERVRAAAERGRAEARQDALVELGDRLRNLRDPAEIAHAAAEVIGRALGADRAGYGTVDAAQEVFRVERDWTGGGRVASMAGAWRVADFWPDLAAEHARGVVVAVEDVARDPRTAVRAGAYAAAGVRAFIDVPVAEAGRVAAFLYVHAAASRAWTADEVAFVHGVAERAWAAAERARADEDLRAGGARLRLALDAGRLGTWELDMATGAAVRSPGHDAIFGYEGAAAPEWGFERFMLHVLPDDRRHVERSFRAAVEGGVGWHFECRIRRADGEVRWIEARGQPVRAAEGRLARMLGVVADVTERKLAEERRGLMVGEMNHRAKNALAVVQAMLRLTKADDVPTFVRSVEGRVAALARAHTVLASQEWSGSNLRDLVQGELAPFLAGRATVEGPPVTLPAVAAQPLAMALHELATNAAKHGSLSALAGSVAVAWRLDGPRLVIRWAESGGPPVPGPPKRRGFGSRLLEATIRQQLGGSVEKSWAKSGVVCDIELPLTPRGEGVVPR